ncbi:MAG: ABC transporter substrate-binding protein [Bacilli bacterium]|nr:ABC transporter substrate-binding protein [Bacilli bacterium]
MKKIIIGFITLLVIALISYLLFFTNKENKDNDLVKVKVAEVAHSVFYAPQYIAIKKGYFKDEGIDIDLTLTPGADKVTAAVLSGDVQIGFCGSEASIYVYNSGRKDYIKTFASLTQRDGSFIVSREKIDNFTLDNLKGKYIIGGRVGGMPEMTLEYTLKQNGINLDDLTIDTSVEFASMASAFISGTGDFVTLFEPNATQVENEGYGYVVGYVGEYGGKVPYTSYNALSSYIKNNKDTVQKFTNAINKGLDYVAKTDPEKIAKEVIDFFPDITINELTKMIQRYKDNDAWKKNTYFSEEEFNHLQDIMIEAKELEKKVPYNELVDTSFSKNE